MEFGLWWRQCVSPMKVWMLEEQNVTLVGLGGSTLSLQLLKTIFQSANTKALMIIKCIDTIMTRNLRDLTYGNLLMAWCIHSVLFAH